MNQAELAKRIGLSRTSITNIERGRQRLLVDQFCRVAEILLCDRDYLLAGLAPIISLVPKEAKSQPDMPSSVARFVESLGVAKAESK